jgi:PAS domain S-box-containing protein
MDDRLMANAIGAAGLAILILDDSDRIIDSNPPADRMLGCVADNLVGIPVSAFLPLEPGRHTGPGSIDGNTQRAVHEITGRDKANRPLHLVVEVVRWADTDGRALSTVLMRDIADERELSRIMQKNLILSDNAIRGANIGVFEYNPLSRSVTVSDIWRQMLELAPDENVDLQQEWRSRVHPDDLAAALEPVRMCVESGAERANCEYRLQSRDRKQWRWMRTEIAVAQRDQAGNASLLVGAQTDITDRKVTEEALRVSVEQFRSAFYNAPIGKAIVGLDGAQQMVNPALCALLGYTESELLGTKFQTLTHPDDLDADLSQLKLLMEGEISSYTLEKRYYRANGSTMWGKLSVGMVRNAEGKPDHFVSQVVDITEQRRLNELKNEFIAVVSHELRTPLTSILGALTLLASHDDVPFSDEVQRLLFIAKLNGDRLHVLVNDILDFEKFSVGQMRFALSPHPIIGLVEETMLINPALADKYGVRFATDFPDRGLIGIVDPKRFHQVMTNLMSNAAKFATAGSAVDVSAERNGPSIRVSVSNIGAGIPDSFRDQVFKPFSQASSMSDRRFGGTGLGLSISKQIVEQMGGEIGFDSVPQGRTTFWFTVRSA